MTGQYEQSVNVKFTISAPIKDAKRLAEEFKDVYVWG